MKKLLVASLCICLLPVSAWCESKSKSDWYSISMAGICDEHDLTKFIKDIKEQGDTYTESNITKEGGKIVSVNLVHHGVGGYSIPYRFYRGMKRCKAAAAALSKQINAEENKYK